LVKECWRLHWDRHDHVRHQRDFQWRESRGATGTLSLAATGGPTVGGNFTVANGAVLDLTGGQTRTYEGNYIGRGGGTIRVSNGTLQVGASGATFNFTGNIFQWTGGTITGPSVLTNTGTMNLSGSNPKSLTVLTLNNAGVVNWTGGGIFYMYDGTVFNNLASGLFDVKDDATLSYYSGVVPTFNNAGIVRKSGGGRHDYLWQQRDFQWRESRGADRDA